MCTNEMDVIHRPDPHPLDFDWRFTDCTVNKLSKRFSKNEHVLLMGCPSIASEFATDSSKISFTLVERQNIIGIENQFNLDINIDSPLRIEAKSILIDAPWYLKELKRWLSWASQCLLENGIIYTSLWPENTRPESISERQELFSWLQSWSDFQLESSSLSYVQPHFEVVAQENNPDFSIEKRWLMGDLLIIKPHRRIELEPPFTVSKKWLRYVIGDLQLAVKVDQIKGKCDINPLEKDSWIWPHVSRRAAKRENISLWSSDNRAASIVGSEFFTHVLDDYLGIGSKLSMDFDTKNKKKVLDVLKQWNIPEQYSGKVYKWHHLE